ncbi:hypothetical protein [Streptacidiphilus neutrinimicus]|uniref:hypothetical protein n=1 Tax=Streptacidiphilus neutrinimicus TaxID=105420 RepID=UPI0005A7306B|nr:hypothetical protein [Streptacidiphilus neutrinimicus]
MTSTAEITVEVVEHDPHDGDAVLAVLAEAFQATAEMSPTPMPMTATPTSPSTSPPSGSGTMCRARSFLTMPEAAAVLRSAPAHLNQPVDVDILGPADAVEQARTLLAGVFTVQDLGWVSGEHEFETRLRLT